MGWQGNKMKKLGFILITIFLIATTLSWASVPTTDTTTVSWTPPTTNTDGSPLTDLKGYTIFYGTAPGVYDAFIDVGNVTSYQFIGLKDNTTYYYVIVACDVVDICSVYSVEVFRTINFTVLKEPSDVVVGP